MPRFGTETKQGGLRF